MERQADWILKDLAVKASEDVEAAVRRTQMLVDHPMDVTVISMAASGHALGIAMADFYATMPEIPFDVIVDRFFDLVRETVKVRLAGIAARNAGD
jgi:hypothetical protein